MDTDEYRKGYNHGWQIGYRMGDIERQALAQANSDLRSEVRELRRIVGQLP